MVKGSVPGPIGTFLKITPSIKDSDSEFSVLNMLSTEAKPEEKPEAEAKPEEKPEAEAKPEEKPEKSEEKPEAEAKPEEVEDKKDA